MTATIHAATRTTNQLLDFWMGALSELEAGRGDVGTRLIGDELLRIRATVSTNAWRSLTRSLMGSDQHRVLHQDPLTRRAFHKPRGYAGDAVTLDFMYGSAPLPDDTTDLGSTVYSGTSVGPATLSVKRRRDFLARYIDEAAEEYRRPGVLAVAAGHLREGQRCRALASGQLRDLVALDHDPRSLGVVDVEQSHFGVTTRLGSVRHILRGALELGHFDVVYSAGLYDYLDGQTATVLTARLFAALNPGGRLLIANFAPELRDIGYLEAIMDWWLIYRDEEAIRGLMAAIPSSDVCEARTWRDDGGNIVYLEVRRTA